MTLYVLRHGIAEDGAPGGDDRTCVLTPRGRIRLRAAVRGMRALRLRIDLLLASPLSRTTETAAIVSEVYGGQPAPRVLPALAPGIAPAETVRALRPLARHGHVMIVGHEPGLSGVVSLLLTGSPDGMSLALKKGGLIALELSDRAADPRASLHFMLTPRQLRRLGR